MLLSIGIHYIFTKVAQTARPAKKNGRKISNICNKGVSSRSDSQGE